MNRCHYILESVVILPLYSTVKMFIVHELLQIKNLMGKKILVHDKKYECWIIKTSFAKCMKFGREFWF